MAELFADAGLALKAVEEDGIGFQSGWGILRATWRLSRRSVARKMDAMPLRATGASMR